MASRDRIRLYYWRGIRGLCASNFGDALSPLIISRISGNKVVYAIPSHADMMGIGSILGHASKLWHRPLLGRINPLYVWGSGTLLPTKVRTRFMKFVAVRGPQTRDLLDLDSNMPLGDPGLLATLLLEGNPRPKFSLGVVPHWEEGAKPAILELMKRFPHCKMIDVTNPDVLQTVRAIASCEIVLSSSLHGLVVADSFGIPNARFRHSKTQGTDDWKYLDYFSGVGRPHLPVIDCLSAIRRTRDLANFLDCANPVVVAAITQKLIRLLRSII